ncbi:hypothetical protein CN918_31950 [Priestia megaterium]|nr:hypothetical protein CN918_31950 [Priestia megaterium]
MNVKRTFFLALLVVLCLIIMGVDIASAAEGISNDDAIMNKGGFAEQTGNFKNIITTLLIIGIVISGYIFYKKEK